MRCYVVEINKIYPPLQPLAIGWYVGQASNPYSQCDMALIEYIKNTQNILTDRIKYFRNIVRHVVNIAKELANTARREGIIEFIKRIIQWARCIAPDFVTYLLNLLNKLINSTFLANYFRIIIDPNFPYGFYIVIYPIMQTHFRSRIYNALNRLFTKIIVARLRRRVWRIFPPGKAPRIFRMTGLDKVLNNAIADVQNKLIQEISKLPERITDTIVTKTDQMIDKMISKHLSKFAKYDIRYEYTTLAGPIPMPSPTTEKYDVVMPTLVTMPPPANSPHINEYYFGLHTPSLFFRYSDTDSFFGSIIKDIVSAVSTVLPIPKGGTAIPKEIKNIKDKKERAKMKKEYRRKLRKQRRRERKFAGRFTRMMYGDTSLPTPPIFGSLHDIYTPYKLGEAILNQARDGIIIENVEKITKKYQITAKNDLVYVKKTVKIETGISGSSAAQALASSTGGKETGISTSSVLIMSSFMFTFLVNSNYVYSDSFLFQEFSKKLYKDSDHSFYLMPYYVMSRPAYEILAWQVNDIDPSENSENVSLFLPAIMTSYMISAASIDGGMSGSLFFQNLMRYIEYNIIDSTNYISARRKLSRPLYEWYQEYLTYLYDINKTPDKEKKAMVEHMSNTFQELKKNRPFFVAGLEKEIEEFERLRVSNLNSAIEKGMNIASIINTTILPLDARIKDSITKLIDWQIKSENYIFYDIESGTVKHSMLMGHRAAEREAIGRYYGVTGQGPKLDFDPNVFKLLNPALAIVLQSQEIIYQYMSSVDHIHTDYIMVSLEPATTNFDLLPARLTYNLLNDENMVNYLKRRGYDLSDPKIYNAFAYNYSISVFTDLLPIKSLTIEYDDIETSEIEVGHYRIPIPIGWNVYMPNIRVEIYDNAYRDLYNYFLKYLKTAFYKGGARPPMDISFILDIITLNADFSLQNILSYLVVPKNINMKYIEYDAEQPYDTDRTITIDFSVIGFIYYNLGVITTSSGTSEMGKFNFVSGSFVEADLIDATDINEKMIQYANDALRNFYGVYNLQPNYVLVDTNRYKKSNEVHNRTVYASDSGSLKIGLHYINNPMNNNVYTINNVYTLPASHVIRYNSRRDIEAGPPAPTQIGSGNPVETSSIISNNDTPSSLTNTPLGNSGGLGTSGGGGGGGGGG